MISLDDAFLNVCVFPHTRLVRQRVGDPLLRRSRGSTPSVMVYLTLSLCALEYRFRGTETQDQKGNVAIADRSVIELRRGRLA